ncbi:MFS transporter [Pseudactinotalea sp. HY160]|uniref:CynX/NimT family MFS transporter n=1 Tax=Pseudactinotalea sp. HY160 TaxID=2654490 RepID=UPI00128D6BA9|nr:MFS transporter [Pseudactinotalea sp. HY160]MPV51163.1 MFS transporter [Pseudactinotalea sp. HY160]
MSALRQAAPEHSPARARPAGGDPAGAAELPGRSARGGRFGGLLLAAGLLLIGLNLRIGVASVGPVLDDIRASLGLSATAASLLTTIPVIAFGAFAFLTPALTRRFGMHRLLGATMIALAAGIVLRLHPSMSALFAGTVVVGAAIAIGNVVMPAAIKRDFSHRAGLMMGLYSTALFVGAALASGLTVPLLPLAGGAWQAALALWAIPAVAAVLLWIPQLRRSSGRVARARSADGSGGRGGQAAPALRAILRDPVALAVTALMGLQSMSYYAALTWVPSILSSAGMGADEAGWMLSFSAFPGIAASLVTPALARRARPAWLPIVLAAGVSGVAFAGLALAPTAAPYVWMTLLGLGQGAAISLALSYIVWRSPDAHHTGQVSTMAQGFGYLLAGLGPIGLGALRSATGGWTVPIAALGVMLVAQLIAGVAASRPRLVGARGQDATVSADA